MKASVLSEYLLKMIVREGDLDVYIGLDRDGLPVGAAVIRQDPPTGIKTITLSSIAAFENGSRG